LTLSITFNWRGFQSTFIFGPTLPQYTVRQWKPTNVNRLVSKPEMSYCQNW